MSESSIWMQLIQLVILAIAYVIGQFIHIVKSNNLDSKQLFKKWYKEHAFSFWIQIIVGLSVLEVLMSQFGTPNQVFGWFTFFYAGVNAGIAGSSIGMTADREIKKEYQKRKNGGN